MNKGKWLIKVLYHLFKWLLNINLVLGLGTIGFIIFNIISPKKEILASYLGKFVVNIKSAFNVNNTQVFVDSISGNTDLIVNSNFHPWMVLLYTIIVVGISLIYSFLFYKLFEILHNSVKQGSPFSDQIALIFGKVALVSIVFFSAGAVLSLLKLYFIHPVEVNGMIIKPAFDNGVFTFLWLSIGFFIMKEIYQVGINLKKEQDLTI